VSAAISRTRRRLFYFTCVGSAIEGHILAHTHLCRARVKVWNPTHGQWVGFRYRQFADSAVSGLTAGFGCGNLKYPKTAISSSITALA